MALNGSISTNVWTDPDYGHTWKVVLNWTATQNASNNTSTISWNLKSSTTSANGYVVISELRVKFADEQIYYRGTSNHTNGYNGTLLASGTKTITHNADGTKSLTASVEAGIYNWAINKSGSGTIALNTIPRSSGITSAGNVTLGNSCNIKWTPASSSFQYKLTFSLGSWSATTGFISPNTTSAYTYTGYTIPNNSTLLGQISSSTTGTMSVKLATYNSSGDQIGSTSATKTFTVTVPSNVVPTIGTISLNPADINNQNILVNGKNKITVSVSGCSGGTGSGIKSYTFSGPGISYTGTNTSVTSSSAVSASATSNTNLTYTVTVTDNRGRSASKTASIICYAYAAPYFTSFNAYRVDSSSSTTANDSGTYVRCTYGVAYSSVNGTNDVNVTIYYKKGTGNWASTAAVTNSTSTSGDKTLSDIANDSTYTIYAQVTDNYSGSSSSTQITVFSTARIMNIKSDGKGVAFGKMAETSNLLDVAWALKTGGAIDTDKPEQTMKNLSYKGSNVISSTAADTTANWGAQGNLATVFYSETGKITDQPSQYGFVLNLTNGPNATEVHQLWTTQPSGSLAHRGGNSSGWNGSWKTILDSSNYTSYVDKKPVNLYTTSTGNSGTITLSQSVENFTYLEIFYSDENNTQFNSVRVYSPNNKYVTLSCIEPRVSDTYLRTYLRSQGWTISGTTMTVGRSDGQNTYAYTELIPGSNVAEVVKVTARQSIKIYQVVGYYNH